MQHGYALQELAVLTGSTLQGDPACIISSVAAVEQAQSHDISYIRGGKYRHYLHSSCAGALILPPELATDYTGNCLINPDPYLAYARVVAHLYPVPAPPAGIHPSAVVAPDVRLGEGCSLGAYVVVGKGSVLGEGVILEAGCVIGENCRIGTGTHLYPRVTLGRDTVIGARCILHSGAVLGADGFGFAPAAGTWYKIPQVGNVILGDDVEVGANTTIDRAALGSTVIGQGVKLDNLVQIAHNVQIGDHTALAGCSAVAGSTRIGSHCRIAGMCAITGHLEICDHVTVTATSLVTHSITKPGVYSSGTTAGDNAAWRKNAVRFHQLDQLARRLAEVERQLAAHQHKD